MAARKTTSRGKWMQLTSPETLLALIRQRGYSYERMARYSGCSKGFISHLIAGRKRTCTESLARDIAEALDVPVEILFVARASIVSGGNVRRERKAA